MTTTHCDRCGALIDRKADHFSVTRESLWQVIVLCARCGIPAAALMERITQQDHPVEPERRIEA